MAKFLTRVELHHANENDYELLHAEMAIRGFSREITGDNGQSYQLPTAEYVIRSSSELEDVRALACAAAKTTGRKFEVIVVQYIKSAWKGLAPLYNSLGISQDAWRRII